MRQVAGRLRLDMAAYRDLAAFAQFGSDLDKATQSQLNRGQKLQEILKQPQYAPASLEDQVMILFAGTNGYVDKVPVEKVREWEQSFLRFMETSYPEIGREIDEKKQITAENDAKLRQALEMFNSSWTA